MDDGRAAARVGLDFSGDNKVRVLLFQLFELLRNWRLTHTILLCDFYFRSPKNF
jgi:hypothetical protein